MNRATLRKALMRAAHASCMIILIVVCAKIFGYFFTLTQVDAGLVQWVGSLQVSPG